MNKLWTSALLLLLFSINSNAQENDQIEDSAWKLNYRAFATKENDLNHVKLVASFDYAKSYLNGEVWLDLHPHFYPTNSLTLDAKAMAIHEVAIIINGINKKLSFEYDSLLLKIQLDKQYTSKEKYTIYIKYTARPNEYNAKGSSAITDAKGMYFINPLGLDKNKPTQIWTQGETEGTSVWIPIIDKPNQKCTQEFQLTVPSKYVSLSNGLLVNQIDNKNGTRQDIWKMDQPHSPYLFFIGIGDYAIVKDFYKVKDENAKGPEKSRKIEVSYYIEREYEKEARKIYGKTPTMIAFYEQILGISFPWSKYAQISGRDYVSGAMENTTCTLHGDAVQQNARELVDGNNWESTIAHELFHQWFGDLVTAESWSNLTVNESFADYSQTLWQEHSKGKDAGQYENYTGMRSYLSSPSDGEKNLVRFFYKDREDMFDLVSYQKGGRILNMLRHYVGDDAFFASLHKYLTDNKFNNGSAIKLKLAFEAVTGKDLNWFFNQWYFDNGHPYVRITQKYLAEKKQVLVVLQQTQTLDKIFELPIGIDVYAANNKTHYNVWSKNRIDSFYFPASVAPDNVNVDNDKVLLWAKEDVKPLSQFIYQYKHATNFLDRFEAINEVAENMANPEAQDLIKSALQDTFYIIRQKAIHAYNPAAITSEVEETFANMAIKDPSNEVREDAIDAISALNKSNYKDLYLKWTKEPSYLIAGAALEALEKIDSAAAIEIATKESKNIIKKRLNSAVTNILSKYGDETVFEFIATKYESLSIQSEEKFYMTMPFAALLIKTTDEAKFKKGIDLILAFRNSIPENYKTQTDAYFNTKIFGSILKAKKQKGEDNLVKIVSAVLPSK
jgi:aminopeptidase N